MKKIDEKFISNIKGKERKTLHKGLDLLIDLVEATSKKQLTSTGLAIESYTDLVKRYCAALTAMEEFKNA